MKALWFVLILFAVSARGETPTSEDTQWIADLGGTVTRNAQGLVTAISLRGTWVTDTDLRRLNRYPALSVLDLSLTHIPDGGMQDIKNLRGITDFDLYFAEYVTDEGVAAIKDWNRLKRLNLHGTKAGDTALEHIAGLTLLESLDVGSTLMTDVGLERLTSLTNLRTLTMAARATTRTSGVSPCLTQDSSPFSLSRTCAPCRDDVLKKVYRENALTVFERAQNNAKA